MMDGLALRVYSSMYNLGLTEDQIVKIEEEARSTTTRGVANMALCKGKYVVYVDKDEKNVINVKKMEKKIPVPSRIITRVLVDFEIPEEAYDIHAITKFRVSDYEPAEQATDLAYLKELLIDRLMKKTTLGLTNMKSIFWLFDAEYNFDKAEKAKPRRGFTEIVKVFERNNKRLAIYKTADTEYDREGYGMSRRNVMSSARTVYSWGVCSCSPKDKEYNHVDEGREIYREMWICDELRGKINEKEADVLHGYLHRGYCFLDERRYGELQNEARLNLMNAKREGAIEEAEKSFASILETNFNKGKTVERNGVKYNHKQIVFESGYVIRGDDIREFITGQRFLRADGVNFRTIYDGYISCILSAEFVRNRNAGMYGANQNDGTLQVSMPASVKNIQLGNIKIKVEAKAVKKRKIEASHLGGDAHYGKESCVYRANGRRVRKDELPDILSRAVSYQSQADYDAFLDSIEKAPLVMQDIVKNGMEVSVKLENSRSRDDDNDLLPKGEDKYLLIFRVEQNGRRFSLLIGDKKYPIKSMPTFLQLGESPTNSIYNRYGNELNRLCSLLSRAVDIPPAEVGDLIKTGRKAYNEKHASEIKIMAEKVARSKEFIAHAVELAKAVHRKLKEKGHDEMEGWEFKSVTGRNYFVDATGKTYAFKTPTDLEYLCIVDANLARQEYEINDSVAKRILALYHDQRTASEIYTLDNFMKGHRGEVDETEDDEESEG